MLSAFKTRDYRLLFAGQGISALGDQFNLIALPWLVLTLTHDPFQLGLVLAIAGIPRALLMLVGGAWADRHSPRTIMLVSDVLRFGLAAALATAILAGVAQMWMVYVLALAFGVVSGFFMPAAQAGLSRYVLKRDLDRQLPAVISELAGAGMTSVEAMDQAKAPATAQGTPVLRTPVLGTLVLETPVLGAEPSIPRPSERPEADYLRGVVGALQAEIRSRRRENEALQARLRFLEALLSSRVRSQPVQYFDEEDMPGPRIDMQSLARSFRNR